MRLDLGNGFIIRPYRDSDLDSLVEHANNPNVSRNLEDRFPYPYTAEDARKWLAEVREQAPLTSFAIADEAGVIGGIGLLLHRDIYRVTAELGYWLGEAYWGRGIATRAVRAITQWAFDSLALERIQARVFDSNLASCRVLEKAGFTREGRLRSSVLKLNLVMDLLVYAILREEL